MRHAASTGRASRSGDALPEHRQSRLQAIASRLNHRLSRSATPPAMLNPLTTSERIRPISSFQCHALPHSTAAPFNHVLSAMLLVHA